MTYSLDFRQHVLAYKEKYNLSFEQTSQHFDVGIRTLFRWSKDIAPCQTKKRPALKVDMQKLKQDVESYPDDYQWERGKRLGVGQPTIHYALKRLNITFKKNTSTP